MGCQLPNQSKDEKHLRIERVMDLWIEFEQGITGLIPKSQVGEYCGLYCNRSECKDGVRALEGLRVAQLSQS
jgi:hypothetical protein